VDVAFGYRFPNENNPGRDSLVNQRFRVWGNGEITCNVDCDWQAIGTPRTKNPMLRVAFDTPFDAPTATYEVPFGALVRPNDGREFPALKWADLGQGNYGVSVINDSKYGYSASGNTLRLSLIRSSFDPDPVPNPGLHHWRYSIVPHQGDWRAAGIVRKAAEFNQELLAVSVPYDARGTAPLSYSPVSLTDSNVVATALKRGEDAGDLILRGYESTGKASLGSIRLNVGGSSARWVNFVEDDLGPAQLNGDQIPFNLHGFEIKTVKIKLAQEHNK
jgi:alpha-mannosidase